LVWWCGKSRSGEQICVRWSNFLVQRAKLWEMEQLLGSASKFEGHGANSVFREQNLKGWSNFEGHGANSVFREQNLKGWSNFEGHRAKFGFSEQNQYRWSKNGGRRASLVHGANPIAMEQN